MLKPQKSQLRKFQVSKLARSYPETDMNDVGRELARAAPPTSASKLAAYRRLASVFIV